ncbi:D-tyrosyl-tRNA(Tyr) deacylase [Myxococcota bacterium]|nr:D-tyrosyl-tRNA(Tyr) deacylase [Myxococcota bacterium]MBU1537343.1 D-tyrosyl-tRNA(Tyr) deacylase [Myxococcota bacterium]
MITIIQRVLKAEVTVEGKTVGSIGHGLLALVGMDREDAMEDVLFTARKLTELRIFTDESGKFNHSVLDVGGALLLVSQFTLLGDTRKGRRPSFSQAAQPETARVHFDELVSLVSRELPVATGIFGAHMEVALINDGPVTMILDSTLTRRGNPRRS